MTHFTIALALLLTSLSAFAGSIFDVSRETFAATYNSPCQEDQVLAVQPDSDPTHGLTWACEGAQDFAERYQSERALETLFCSLDDAILFNPDANRFECVPLDDLALYHDPTTGQTNWYVKSTGPREEKLAD